MPMKTAAAARRSAEAGALGVPALMAKTAIPTTMTQTRKESRVGKTRKSTGKGRRAASMPTKCMAQMATASEIAAPASSRRRRSPSAPPIWTARLKPT